jgi:epoxide hydrolase-like predicted phosphatase
VNESIEDLKKIALSHNNEIPGTVDVIKKLKEKYRLAVLSNNATEWVARIKEMIDIEGIFDVLIFSNEVKMMKPDREMFMLCAEKLGLKPDECLFVDDQDNNLDAAKSFGFNIIKFENAGQLEQDLKKMGVEI